MEIKSALLCDFASVREGLLHILGGGITRMWRPSVPTQLGIMAALVLDLEPEVAAQPHQVRIAIDSSTGQTVAEIVVALQLDQNPRLEAGEHALAPLAVQLQPVVVPDFGRYDMQMQLDDEPVETLTFWILHPEEQVLPPLTATGPPAE
jgi:hypothetical protein